MPDVYYDLHMHSCLSPCGDSEMTVNNIVHMAMVQELSLIALTDHNSCKNCPAFLKVAAECGMAALPGMELNTAEEIHVVCLFPGLENALEFDRYVARHLLRVKNNPKIFGEQLILDEGDQIVGEEEYLLINATDISVAEVLPLVRQYGGLAYPAHIDKSSYSILSSIGALPPEYGFTAVEVAHPERFAGRPESAALPSGLRWVTSSDAHYLWDISPKSHSVPLPEPTFAALQAYLEGG